MDADQLDLKITGRVVTPGQVLGVQTLLPLAYAAVVARHGLTVLRLAELAEAADRTGRPCLRLPSHADHDANQMAKIAPIGMLFAPSRDGRSHCPEEGTEPDDIAVCLAALTAVVIRLDEELAP